MSRPVYWIGVDEAGYGARLGPLVVSASLWCIDHPDWSDTLQHADDFLSQADSWSWRDQFPQATSPQSPGRLGSKHGSVSPPHAVADSKQVYQPGHGLETLQQIVESLLQAIGTWDLGSPNRHPQVPTPAPLPTSTPAASANAESNAGSPQVVWQQASLRFRQHVERVNSESDRSPPTAPAYWQAPADAIPPAAVRSPDHDHDLEPDGRPLLKSGSPTGLPEAATCPTSPRPSAAFRAWESPTLRPVRLVSQVISEQAFNRGLQSHGNKANLLSATSLELARGLLGHCPTDARVVIDFDRHGGRKRYLPMLLHHFPADWMDISSETPAESHYRWTTTARIVDFRFSVDGERRYPVAVASLASKYTRELGMECLNAYWRCRIADLQPTAGYPLDAARWLREVQARLPALPCPLDAVWRNA